MNDVRQTIGMIFWIIAAALAALAVVKLFGVPIGRLSAIELAAVAIACAQVR